MNKPTAIPKKKYNVIITDPPYLEEGIFCKMAETVELLSHDSTNLIIATGLVMKDVVRSLFETEGSSIYTSNWEPKHNGLQNNFRLYTNYPQNG